MRCVSVWRSHDDYVDSMTQAIMRIKQGGIVRNKDSYKDEPSA